MNISKYIIPVLVLSTMFGGYFLRHAFTQPTTSAIFESGQSGGNLEDNLTLTCKVQGVKCKGTANFFTKLYTDIAGISTLETVASDHKAVFTYNPKVISPDDIRAIMEKPIRLNNGSTKQIFTCLEMK
ncbi:MAG: hypothetical protein HN757_14830 [Calditrichaeota bacterium]|nr:hypothetical protein [Calditrichota bacterium]